jgi:hypothetical protein
MIDTTYGYAYICDIFMVKAIELKANINLSLFDSFNANPKGLKWKMHKYQSNNNMVHPLKCAHL